MLAALVIGFHLLAVLAVMLSTLTLPIQMLLAAVVAAQALYLCHRYVWLTHPRAIRSIRWSETQWFVGLGDGREIEVVPTASCRVFGWVLLLQFRRVKPLPGAANNSCMNAWVAASGRSQVAIRRLRVQLIQTGSSQN